MNMKTLRFFTFDLALLLLAACNIFQPPERNPKTLSLKLECPQKEITSFDDFQCQVYLSNQSNSSILVHKRLYWLPFPNISSYYTEMLVLISDSSGNFVYNEYLPNYQLPYEGTLERLQPGEQISRMLYFKSHFFTTSLFNKGGTYTVVAIYQNNIDISKTVDRVEVPSWVGSIRSNEETFVILP